MTLRAGYSACAQAFSNHAATHAMEDPAQVLFPDSEEEPGEEIAEEEEWSPELAMEGPGKLDAKELNRVLLKRLMDVVALPSSVGNLQDRAISGDLLLELLVDADIWARELCSRRLEEMTQAPKRLLRFLALDIPAVSERIIANNKGLDDADLIQIVLHGGAFHRRVVASRPDLGPSVASAIAESGDIDAIQTMLRNQRSVMSDRAVDAMVSISSDAPQLTQYLILRDELRPAHALAMFWWCSKEDRRTILMKFSAERLLLIEGCAEVFKQIGKNGLKDPTFAKAMLVIERRQRNRAALALSRFESLDEAIEEAATAGMTVELRDEISTLSGITPQTGERIMLDPGGEGLAVLCKATGLKRNSLRSLWMALRRDGGDSEKRFEHVLDIYECMAVAKAQTVLRYWNWTMETAFAPSSTSLSPGLMRRGGIGAEAVEE